MFLFIKNIQELLYFTTRVDIAAVLRTSVVNLESFYAEERPNEENRASWVGVKRRMPAHSNSAVTVVGDMGVSIVMGVPQNGWVFDRRIPLNG